MTSITAPYFGEYFQLLGVHEGSEDAILIAIADNAQALVTLIHELAKGETYAAYCIRQLGGEHLASPASTHRGTSATQ